MEFTCPHCGKTSPVIIPRKGNTGAKANEARRRNLEAGGFNRKASPSALASVYASRKDWTWQDFVAAVEKKTGAVYSRAQAFVVLKRLKAQKAANAVMFNDGGLAPAIKDIPPLKKNNAPVTDAPLKASPATRGKKVSR